MGFQKINLNEAKEKVAEKKDQAIQLAGEARDLVLQKKAQAQEDFSVWKNKPITLERLQNGSFQFPSLIRIVDTDSRINKRGCEDAIGFDEGLKAGKLVTFLDDFVDELGLDFIPALDDSVYYVDPINSKKYIDIDEYFDYLRKEKVNELIEVAQCLGAEYVKVSLLEEKKSVKGEKNKNKASAKVDDVSVKVEHQHDESRKEYISSKILAEHNFAGGEPRMPKLNYLKNENEINFLIGIRMNEESPAKGRQVKYFKTINTTGIKKSDAIAIDGALKKLGFSVGANSSVENLVDTESLYEFEYEIVFPE